MQNYGCAFNQKKALFLFTFNLQQLTQRINKTNILKLLNILPEAKDYIKKLFHLPKIMKLILNISKIIENDELLKLQSSLFYSGISLATPHFWKSLNGSPTYKLDVLKEVIEIAYKSIKQNYINTVLLCIELSYAMEDISIAGIHLPQFIETLARLILFIDDADLLYVSMPVWTRMENRSINSTDKFENLEREGGILRILMKLIFISMKEKIKISYTMLKFLIFRENEEKEIIQTFLGIKTKNEKKINIKRLTLIGILQMNPDQLSKLKLANDFIVTKAIFEHYGILAKKPIKSSSGGNNFFSNPQCLSMYIFVTLLQLIYYELFEKDSNKDFPKEQHELIEILELYRHGKKPTDIYEMLVELILNILVYKNKKNESKITNAFDKSFEDKSDIQLITKLLSSVSLNPTIDNIYSPLDPNINLPQNIKLPNCNLLEFIKGYNILLSSFFPIALTSKNKSDKDISEDLNTKLLPVLLEDQIVFFVYPMLILITSHQFKDFDSHIYNKSIEEINPSNEENSLSETLILKLSKEFPHIKLNKYKIERDRLRDNIDFIGKRIYNKIIGEQYTELGCWENKFIRNHNNELRHYIEQKYERIMKRNINKKYDKNHYSEFAKLSKVHDEFERCMILKENSNPKLCAGYNYLRHFVIKKILINHIGRKLNLIQFLKSDFRFTFVYELFHNIKETEQYPIVKKIKHESDMMKFVIFRELLHSNNSIPRTSNTYDSEIISIAKTVSGILSLNSKGIFFYNVKMPNINNKVKNCERMIKQWKYEEIKEIIVKPYILPSQAIEIYFNNFKSIFISLIEPRVCKSFVKNLKIMISKKIKRDIIIDDPEMALITRKITNDWMKCDLTNFDYLMLVNKYSGRSFNNINQYPIFPLILTELKNSTIKSELYINNEKKEEEKLDENPSQSICYLPSKSVYGCMAYIEPYSSLPERNKLNSKASLWNRSWDSMKPNSDLIPEFYYLPEMFENRNLLCFPTDYECFKRIPNIILPNWANSSHQFVQINALELESIGASLKLHKWIDLIFGIDQLNKEEKSLNENQVEESDNYTNPMRLFNSAHPQKSQSQLELINKLLIFNPFHKLQNRSYNVSKKATLPINQPIIFIKSFDNQLIVVANDCKIYIAKRKS